MKKKYYHIVRHLDICKTYVKYNQMQWNVVSHDAKFTNPILFQTKFKKDIGGK